MSKSKHPKNTLFMERLTEEFSTGQLVVGISVAFFVMAASFSAGYMVRGYDWALESRVQTAEISPEVPVSPEPAPAEAERRERGTQTSPKAPTTKKPEPEAKPPAKPETASGSGIANLAKPQVTELPPLPSPRQSGGGADAAPTRIEKLPLPKPKPDSDTAASTATVTEATPVEAAPAEAAPAEAPAPEPQPEMAKPVQVAENAVPAPAEETPPLEPLVNPPAAAPSGSGTFGIQLASFQGPDREQKAIDFQRRLKENAAMDSEIFASEDKRYYRVLLTGYKDREAATAACDELKKRAGFADAFPRLVP